MKWCPISEVPPDVDRIVAFDPTHWSDEPRREFDERVCTAERTETGWYVRHYHGGYEIAPTMFCLIELPDGVPTDPRCS